MCKKDEDVQSIRIKLNLTQEELAKKLNISRQFVCSVEKGIKKMPDSKMAELEELYYSAFPHLKENLLKVELLSKSRLKDFKDGIHSQNDTDYAIFSGRLRKGNTPKGEENLQYGSIIVDTDAMEPSIKQGSRIIFEYGKNMQIIDNEIYIFYYKGELFIRRISKNLTTCIIKADNSSYDDVVLDSSVLKEADIDGKVTAVIFN